MDHAARCHTDGGKQLLFEVSDGKQARCGIAQLDSVASHMYLGADSLLLGEPDEDVQVLFNGQLQPALQDKVLLAYYVWRRLQPHLAARAEEQPSSIYPLGDLPQV